MGSPKALLPYRGTTFLDHLIALLTPHCSPVIVVLGAGAAEIRSRAQQPATFVVNSDYRTGMTSSLQCGLRAVPFDAGGALFTLVDHPAVSPDTVRALVVPPRPLVRVPRHGAKRGHPVWISRELFAEFLALPQTAAARDVVRAHAAGTQFLDVDDPGILADIDDPAAYRALIGARA
jgi:CTP:molybdopterin cytidylyltransferase MocA